MLARHAAAHQVVVVRLTKAQRVRRGTVAAKVLRKALSIGARGPLLSGARSQASAAARGAEAALTTLVALLLSGHGLAAAHHITRAASLHRLMVLVHLVVERRRPNWTTSLEDTQLLLV